MANSQGDNDQGLGGTDRERGRDVINDGGNARSASSRRSNRGFASMDPSKQREIASKGGRAAHAKGTAHEFDSGEAREAGRKGGQAVSRNREHMAAIGRKGGEARGAKNAARLAQNGSQNASRAAAQQNTGAQAGLRGDRQVNIPGVAQNTGGASDASFGGERRGGAGESSREQRPESH